MARGLRNVICAPIETGCQHANRNRPATPTTPSNPAASSTWLGKWERTKHPDQLIDRSMMLTSADPFSPHPFPKNRAGPDENLGSDNLKKLLASRITTKPPHNQESASVR